MKTQEANGTGYYLIANVGKKKKYFSGTWKPTGIAFPSQTHASFSPMHQGTVEKQGSAQAASIQERSFGEVCLPPGHGKHNPVKKWPPLALCSEATWKEDSGEFSIFPFSPSLSKWMFPLEKLIALLSFKTAWGLQPIYKLQKSVAGRDGNVFSSINPSS